jgi:hypothetical protein
MVKLLSVGVLFGLLISCGNIQNFSKQKFTKLSQIQVSHESIQNNLVSTVTDTIKSINEKKIEGAVKQGNQLYIRVNRKDYLLENPHFDTTLRGGTHAS